MGKTRNLFKATPKYFKIAFSHVKKILAIQICIFFNAIVKFTYINTVNTLGFVFCINV